MFVIQLYLLIKSSTLLSFLSTLLLSSLISFNSISLFSLLASCFKFGYIILNAIFNTSSSLIRSDFLSAISLLVIFTTSSFSASIVISDFTPDKPSITDFSCSDKYINFQKSLCLVSANDLINFGIFANLCISLILNFFLTLSETSGLKLSKYAFIFSIAVSVFSSILHPANTILALIISFNSLSLFIFTSDDNKSSKFGFIVSCISFAFPVYPQ